MSVERFNEFSHRIQEGLDQGGPAGAANALIVIFEAGKLAESHEYGAPNTELAFGEFAHLVYGDNPGLYSEQRGYRAPESPPYEALLSVPMSEVAAQAGIPSIFSPDETAAQVAMKVIHLVDHALQIKKEALVEEHAAADRQQWLEYYELTPVEGTVFDPQK